MDKMNIDKVSDEEMQDLFTESFEEPSRVNGISEFECTCKREVGGTDILMEVMVTGLAGTPTYEDFHNNEMDGLGRLTISREDKGVLCFEREPDGDYVLHTNDYVVAYRSA